MEEARGAPPLFAEPRPDRAGPGRRPRRAGWLLVAEVVLGGCWLVVFSYPGVSLIGLLLAVVATLLFVLTLLATAVSIGVAAYRRRPRPRLRHRGWVTATTVGVAAATAVLCATRTPMWLRFDEARPHLLELTQEAQRGGGGHRALAGTYYLHDFGSRDCYVFFDLGSGLSSEGGFAYDPGGRVAAAAGYTHLTGPWWRAGADIGFD